MSGKNGRGSLKYLESLRLFELSLVKGEFSGKPRVLEVGAGSGFQSKTLSEWGCHVTAVDIKTSNIPNLFPVIKYDGRNLPFDNESFDIVFTSNVLEHVEDLGYLLKEVKRVVRPGGKCIHVVPSAYWRIWTSVAHYFFILQYIFGRRMNYTCGYVKLPGELTKQFRGWLELALRTIVPPPHGEYESFYQEIFEFRAANWGREIGESGVAVSRIAQTGIFYTGYSIFGPVLGIKTRKMMASFFGSAGFIVIARKSLR